MPRTPPTLSGTTGAESPPLARKPNYGFEKRRKEIDRKAKKDAKREARQQRRREGTPAESEQSTPPAQEEGSVLPVE
jgi:hypothetical protein